MENLYEYRRCLVTFIDILGFREHLFGRPSKEIGEALSLLRELSSGDFGVGPHPPGTAAFSDCIIRVYPVDTQQKIGALYYELTQLADIQASLSTQGVFLRGGMTIGDAYCADGTAFGPAIVRAYELESSFAIYPRIIVDPEVMEAHWLEPALQGQAHDAMTDLQYLYRVLDRSEDGINFIDYLRAVDPMHYDGLHTLLMTHKSKILGAIDKLPALSAARQKLVWLSHYHNRLVADLVGVHRPELVIEISSV